jgi:hypothetical protein
MMKWTIALGAVSFGITLALLTSGRVPPPAPSAARGAAAPALPAPGTPRDVPDDFHSAMRAAAQVGSTPEGLKYQDVAGPVLSNALQARLASCLDDSSPFGQAAFAVVVGIGPDGAVRSTWALPETPLASCVLYRLTGAALPPPPIPDAWMAANITPGATDSPADPER